MFFALSLLVTRRALVRRKLASDPAFYSNMPAHQAEQAKKVNGTFEAIEALNLATINVLSLSMMAAGGTLWYFNINSKDELRRRLRTAMGVLETDRSEKEAEDDFEE